MPLWIEPELEALISIIEMLDTRLSKLIAESQQCADADSFGYYDVAEHITGLALVASQTYLTTLCGSMNLQKAKALALGPAHIAGMAKVQIVNHAANYWKHNSEWNDSKPDHRRAVIEAAFDQVGFPVGTDYPLSGVLTELSAPAPATLRAVADILRAWRVAVMQKPTAK